MLVTGHQPNYLPYLGFFHKIAKADAFVLETIPAENGRDVFELESRDGKIVVRGSSGVAMASGVGIIDRSTLAIPASSLSR